MIFLVPRVIVGCQGALRIGSREPQPSRTNYAMILRIKIYDATRRSSRLLALPRLYLRFFSYLRRVFDQFREIMRETASVPHNIYFFSG